MNISKKGTRFCPAEEIERRAKLIFGRLKTCNYYKALPHNDFVEEIVDFYCTTNELHPFREGNGRTQRAFLTQLIRNAGYDINWADVDGALLMIATIQAAQGVTDVELMPTLAGQLGVTIDALFGLEGGEQVDVEDTVRRWMAAVCRFLSFFLFAQLIVPYPVVRPGSFRLTAALRCAIIMSRDIS